MSSSLCSSGFAQIVSDDFPVLHAANRLVNADDSELAVSASAIQIVRPLESTVDRNRAGSRLLLLAKFLEARILPERIEHRIEPEQRPSKRHVVSQWTCIRYEE